MFIRLTKPKLTNIRDDEMNVMWHLNTAKSTGWFYWSSERVEKHDVQQLEYTRQNDGSSEPSTSLPNKLITHLQKFSNAHH